MKPDDLPRIHRTATEMLEALKWLRKEMPANDATKAWLERAQKNARWLALKTRARK
jgi:hypothetical protein